MDKQTWTDAGTFEWKDDLILKNLALHLIRQQDM
jgi:hypothetical protein